jgi:hypothetical protein
MMDDEGIPEELLVDEDQLERQAQREAQAMGVG